jgi:hypothetical protein
VDQRDRVERQGGFWPVSHQPMRCQINVKCQMKSTIGRLQGLATPPHLLTQYRSCFHPVCSCIAAERPDNLVMNVPRHCFYCCLVPVIGSLFRCIHAWLVLLSVSHCRSSARTDGIFPLVSATVNHFQRLTTSFIISTASPSSTLPTRSTAFLRSREASASNHSPDPVASATRPVTCSRTV